MPLITTIQQVKQFVGGGANIGLSFDSLHGALYAAARDHLVPYIGQTFYDKLNSDADPTYPTNDPVRNLVRRVVVTLALYEYAKTGGVMLSELGIMRVETDSQRTSFRYQEVDYRQDMLEKGYTALEELLVFLSNNAANYTHWDASFHRSTLVRYASEVRKIYGMDLTRYGYEALRGVLQEMEVRWLESLLPAQFVATLRTWHDGTTQLSPQQTTVLTYVKSALVHYAITEGLRRSWVRFDGRRVVHVETTQEQANDTLKTGQFKAVHMKSREHDTVGDFYDKRLTDYLWANKTLFPTCFAVSEGGSNTDTDAWTKPAAEAVQENEAYWKGASIVNMN